MADENDRDVERIKRRAAKAEDEVRDNFLNHIMGMVDGRSYICWLLNICDVHDRQVFYEDPCRNAFWCGIRAVGQTLRADIMRVCPELYIQMMRERNARDTAIDTSISRSAADKERFWNDTGPRYVHPGYSGDGTEARSETFTPEPAGDEE